MLVCFILRKPTDFQPVPSIFTNLVTETRNEIIHKTLPTIKRKKMKIGIILFFGILTCNLVVHGQQVLNMKKGLASDLTSNFEKVQNPIEFGEKESINGSMDFELKLKDEKGILFIFDGTAYDKEDFAVLLWGIAANKINIKDYKTAKITWKKIYNKKLNGHKLKAFKKGFKYEE